MRTSGILLPVSSLPSKYGIGCMSKEAYKFVDFLVKAKQTYWQILPVGPTSYGDSPYQSFSTFAGNPYFIDLEALIKAKLLTKAECQEVNFGTNSSYVDYEKIYYGRFPLLRKAFERSEFKSDPAYSAFCEKQAHWLDTYAAFMAIKDSLGGCSFLEWPEDIRLREPEALTEYTSRLAEDIDFYRFLQFTFYEQWSQLKAYANDKGIQIVGDIPIYVAPDSADAWANPELFQMENGAFTGVAGCPPDGFSATGQLWGNPLYDWRYHAETGYAWWISRIKHCNEIYDVIRIDHFRGFDQFWHIPAGDSTAQNGWWENGPGLALFNAIEAALGKLNIIAEDLGFITDSVRQLLRDTAYPNMKVLEFAFDARDSSGSNDYLPFNYNNNCVVYTGTHDNEPICGWLKSITPEERKMVARFVNEPANNHAAICKGLVRAAQGSVADYCIIPLQDYLCLGNEARINYPSTLGGNWEWRCQQEDLSAQLAKEIATLTQTYGRLPRWY